MQSLQIVTAGKREIRMIPIRLCLRQLFPDASFVGCGDVAVRGINTDSRRVRAGDLFVAINGTTFDGHDAASAAVTAGAVAVLVSRPLPDLRVPQCVVPDTRAAWARLCMASFGMPQRDLTIAGITGTNGKTTTSWILRSILQANCYQTGLLGTIEYHNGIDSTRAALTTPDALTIAELFSQMTSRGTSHCVMEISSHALAQRRCDSVPLSVAAITNITQDHFDFHGGFQNYLESKASIHRLLKPGAGLCAGVDDPGCRQAIQTLPSKLNVIRFGFDQSADARITIDPSNSSESQNMVLHLNAGTISVSTPLVGRHNALNCLAAAVMAEQLNVSLPNIAKGIQQLSIVPGRLQKIQMGQPFNVFVDFAHTADGLNHCLKTVRAVTEGRLICVFGAGGNRDREKRPLMGRAAQAADIVIVTSDNPRNEPAEQIIAEIVRGMQDTTHVHQVVDRTTAIQLAIGIAQPLDSVVIAGRGHETIQEIAGKMVPFSDADKVREALQQWQEYEAQKIGADELSNSASRQQVAECASVNDINRIPAA